MSYFYTDNILLGSGNKFQESNPDFPLVMELSVGIQVKGVCCGPAHCGMWAYSGKAYTWGHARYGRLGHPNEIGVFADDELQVKPREVLSLGQKKVLMMAAGGKFTLFLDNTGKLSHVGLLKPFRSSYDPEMKLIAPADLQPWLSESTISTSPLVKIAAGEEHCLAADNQGKFYVWGVDRMGCLGSEIKALKEPTLIKDFESYSVVDFACGPDYSVAILDASDPDPSQKMYADFRLDSVDKVKNKLRKVKNMREASQPKSAKRTTDGKTKNMNPDQMNVQIEDFLHHSDLEGFAGLRDDSKKIVLNDLINTFLKDKLNINKFSTDYIQLTNMYERVGQNFEEIFYRQIMSDPTVQSEIRFKEPAVRASTAHRSVRALTASTQSTPSQVPQEFDVVKAALSDYFSKLSTSDMKISQKLFEKYQFDQRVEYLQKDKKIGQKMTHLKEVSSQKFLVNNRKLEFRINNVKQKKALLYNQKYSLILIRHDKVLDEFNSKNHKLQQEKDRTLQKLKRFEAWQIQWLNFMNTMVAVQKLWTFKAASNALRAELFPEPESEYEDEEESEHTIPDTLVSPKDGQTESANNISSVKSPRSKSRKKGRS